MSQIFISVEDLWRRTPRAVAAHISCLSFGLILLFWGFAPALFGAIATGHAPSFDQLAPNAAVIVIGLSFIALHHLISRGSRRAAWMGCVISSLLLLMAVGYCLATRSLVNTMHVLVPAAITAATCCLAARARVPRAPHQSADPTHKLPTWMQN
jgi:hypothetical protein